jgi:hypothetical protein
LFTKIDIDTSFRIPDFPSGNTEKILFRLKLATKPLSNHMLMSNKGCNKPKKADSSFFKIWVKDLAGNVSDTLVTETVIII